MRNDLSRRVTTACALLVSFATCAAVADDIDDPPSSGDRWEVKRPPP